MSGFGRPLSPNHAAGKRKSVRVGASPISASSVEGCGLIDIHSGCHGTGEWRLTGWLVTFVHRLTASHSTVESPTTTGLTAQHVLILRRGFDVAYKGPGQITVRQLPS